ncbi:MAG TPA: outer membrane protein transport protein [Polyangia bacterium]|nr:outer membrane protein transport protein [Polyangia bacterium]
MALTRPLVVVLTSLLVSSSAWAGGMFLPFRGARATGRAGAMTAGVDDASALYYNPAGLADIDGWSFLIDGGLVLQSAGYDRVDSGGNPQPHVSGQMNVLPLPTIALTYKPPQIRGKWLTLGLGVWVPYLGIDSWPTNGPQRYSNISINGSLLGVVELAASFRIKDWFWLGVGLENMILHFHSRLMLSACSELNCAPEDPGFDTLTQVDTDSAFTPSGVVGAIFAFQKIRAGINVQLPFFVRSSGTVASRLPTDPFFANSEVHGSAISVDFNLPLTVRLGLEYRPLDRLRLELDMDYEAWSMQKDFKITPHNVYISGVPGIGNYYLNPLTLQRGMQDTFAVHLGAEATIIKKRVGGMILRAGWALETSATPDETASVLTPDALRNVISIGGGLVLGPVRLDAGYAHVFFADRTVTDSQSFQLNPIQPALAVPVGNGRYTISADVLTAGLEARW